jgi:hypothetical protein
VSRKPGARQFRAVYEEEIESYVAHSKARLPRESAELASKLRDWMTSADEDLEGLQAAKAALVGAREQYKKAAKEVSRAGSMVLIAELEQDYEGLVAAELRTLLAQRQWSAFHDVLESLVADMVLLETRAVEYQEFAQGRGGDGAEETPDSASGRLDEPTACRILGVPPSASNEEIRGMYRLLVRLWHPDVKGDAERMVQINTAYEYLRQNRGF